MKPLTYALLLIYLTIFMTGCPIVRGAGNAVEATGEGIGHAVEGTGRAIGETGRDLTDSTPLQ